MNEEAKHSYILLYGHIRANEGRRIKNMQNSKGGTSPTGHKSIKRRKSIQATEQVEPMREIGPGELFGPEVDKSPYPFYIQTTVALEESLVIVLNEECCDLLFREQERRQKDEIFQFVYNQIPTLK
jgi:hypothetical protein